MANPKKTRSSKRSPKTEVKRKPIKILVGFNDWIHLPVTIRGKRIRAQQEFPSIEQALILYRAYVSTCNFIATNIDKGILNSFKWLQKELKDLVAFEENYYPRLTSLKTLRAINERWDIFSARKNELQNSIEHAPSAFSFYNKMASFKEKHQLEK